ncbi:MAG: VWA domain-containing protein [Desulfobacterales bacterium]
MAKKTSPFFWIVLIAVVCALTWYAYSRYQTKQMPPGQSGPQETASQQQTPGTSDQMLELNFYSSSAKANWINEMVRQFNDARHMEGGKRISVKVFHVTSGASLDDLKEGKIQPDMWSPGDESWLEMAASHWRNVRMKTLFQNYTDLVNIPLVIAMWEPMAKVLGHPNPISWKDIAKVAANPQGWAAYGHPEWGKFRWGHAHPDANSGFLTIISEVYAALDKTEGLKPEDLGKPEVVSFLKEFEGAVEHYGLSNSWIDDLMYAKGPAYLSATVQYENTIIQSNEKHGGRPFRMTAVYPAEGNFWTRHPVAILEEEWMTPEKNAACRQFIDFLLRDEAQRAAMKMGLRPIRKDFPLEAPFDAAHGVIADIASDKVFQVPDENVLKRIRDLWEEAKVPATIAMVIDRSGSMKGEAMENAKTGAIQFVRQMKPRDQVMILAFHHEISVLSDLCEIRQCGEELQTRLEGIFADGKTSLYDAVAESYKKLRQLKQTVPNRRYAILVLSDGKDTSSHIGRHDLTDLLPAGEDYDVPKIYTIAYGAEADRDFLTEISNRTNARIFSSNPDEIKKTYTELSANF